MAKVSAACSITLLTHDEYTLPLVRNAGWWLVRRRSNWQNLPHAHLQHVIAASSQPPPATKFDLAIKYVKVNPGSYFESTMMGRSPRCYIPCFVEIGQLVPGKIFKGYYHICAWWPSWSCNQHHVNKFLFPCT